MSVKFISKNYYKLDIFLGYNGNKRIRHVECVNGSLKQARDREHEIKMMYKNNTLALQNNMTMSSLTDEWLKSKENLIGKKTFSEYERICKNIKSCIGHIKIKDINVRILEKFYNELKTCNKGKNKNGYSEKTIKHHYTLVSEILNTGVKWNYIPNNPNKYVTPIKVHKHEVECYTPEEVKQLMEVLQKEPLFYRAVITLAIDSGIRRGELVALTWNDLNFNTHVLSINKAIGHVNGYGNYIKETKSDTSNRSITLSENTIKLLREYKSYQSQLRLSLGNKWNNSQRMFTTELGEDMSINRPYKILQHIIEKYNLKKIKFHALRHTSISLQIQSGIQPQIISKRAGHSNVSITHSVYSHFFDSSFSEVASTMNSYLEVKAN